MSDKSVADLEAERMARFVNVPAQNRKQPAWQKPATTQSAQPTKQNAQPLRPYQQQAAASVGASLQGTMDISTRVDYLNSLLDQGAINEDEYQKRAEPLQVASDIIKACSAGDERTLESLLQQNPAMNVDSIVEKEATPLTLAIGTVCAGKGSSKLLSLLLSRGAQPNRRKAGYTALLSLCDKPRFPDAVNCARVLLEAGADAKATTVVSGGEQPNSCISLAINGQGSPELIRLLCQHGASPNDSLQPHGPILIHCIIEELFDIVSVLLDCRADANARQAGLGASSLSIAITNKNVQLIEELLQHGADRDQSIMREHKTTARELVAQLVKKEPGAYQTIAKMF
jgi:ankyrin repeat protein